MRKNKKYLSIEQAEKLTTQRLLSYYKSISRWLPECILDEDVSYLEERELHRDAIKNLLDEREHVEKNHE